MNMPGEKNEKGHYGYKTFIISTRILIRVLVVVLFVVFAIFVSRRAYSLGYEVASYHPSENAEAEDKAITITMDMTIEDVGRLLIKEGILQESLEAFLIQERISEYHDTFVPGTFLLNENMTIEKILETISGVSEEEESQ